LKKSLLLAPDWQSDCKCFKRFTFPCLVLSPFNGCFPVLPSNSSSTCSRSRDVNESRETRY